MAQGDECPDGAEGNLLFLTFPIRVSEVPFSTDPPPSSITDEFHALPGSALAADVVDHYDHVQILGDSSGITGMVSVTCCGLCASEAEAVTPVGEDLRADPKERVDGDLWMRGDRNRCRSTISE
jgi:hypothetical protein